MGFTISTPFCPMKDHHCTTILVSSLPSGVKHGKTRIDFDEMFPRCQFFTRGFPASHAWWSHQSLIHPLCHSAGIIIPSTAKKKRSDLSYVGGRMKHVHYRFPKIFPDSSIVDWLQMQKKTTHISIWHSNIAMENHPFSLTIPHLNKCPLIRDLITRGNYIYECFFEG